MRHPTQFVFILLTVIQRLFQKTAVFIGTRGFLIDLADKIDIIAKYLDLFSLEDFAVHLDKFKQGQKRGILGMKLAALKRGFKNYPGFGDRETDQPLIGSAASFRQMCSKITFHE